MTYRKLLSAIAVFSALSTHAIAASVTIDVTNLRNSDGAVRIALHDGAEGFPASRKPIAMQTAPANADGVTFVFSGLAPGEYATTLFHDENANEELDTNMLGMPVEGYAFSNDAVGSFGPPSFEDALFEVGEDDLSLSNSLAY